MRGIPCKVDNHSGAIVRYNETMSIVERLLGVHSKVTTQHFSC